ncbi:MAG: choice-of-anchor D domain-containing protein, partial [Chloroflexi bacterium]
MYPPGRGLYPLPPENTRKVWKRLVILGVGFVLLAQTYAGPIAALAATIQTDLFVYQNGDTVTVTGDGFGAAEVVDLVTTDPAATVVNHGSATTGGVGNLTYQSTLTTTVPGLYDVKATGQISGLTASTQFDPPPTPPTNLRYRDDRSSGTGVTLSWPSVGQQSVDCYFVYRSNSSMATLSSNTTVGSCAMPHTNINSLAAIAEVAQASGTLQYVDSAAPAGSIFYYVTAEKVGNNQGESGQSNQVATTSLNPSSGSASHDFGNVTVGTTSSFTSARYNNNSGAAITLRAFAISGANPGDFAVANVSPAVGTSIANGGAVTFTVAFTPGALGARSGSVEVNAQDVNQSSGVFNTHVMPVVGNGVSASGLSAQSASGAYGGTVSLQATLTSGGSGVSGKPIQFSLNGNSVGSATTNSSGVATLSSASLAGINVGNYLAGVSAAFPGDSSYATSSGATSLTVTPASLNVTANDMTRQYGIANPALDATITGFKNGETLGTSDVTGSASCTTTANSGSLVGNYTITCTAGSLTSHNYTFMFAPGTLHVTQAVLTVTADAKSKIYGAGNPALTYTITGFVNGDPASIVSGTANCATTATILSGVGGYPITCTQGTLSATNYAFSFVGGTVTVTQATLTVTADPQSRVYGAGNPALTYIITGFVNGDAASVVSGTANCSTTATLLSGVGGYSITCTQGTLSATNYTFGFVGGTLTVTQATLTVTANSHSREYGDANPILDATISGFKNGENLASSGVTGTASCSTAATTASAVANYSITCTIGSLSAVNYSFTFAAGTLHVTPAGLTVTANDKTREYGDPNPGFDATITGFKNGQNLTTSGVTGTASCSSSATMTSPVADYSITCTIGGLLSGNYSFTFFAPGTLQNGENLATSGVTGTASCSSAAIANSTVADHTISCTIGSLSAHNYSFSFVNGTLRVTTAELTVTANSHSREYGDANPILDATISGLKNGENLASSGVTGTASCSTAATTASAVANYSITCTIGSLSAVNYSFTFAAGTLHVTPAGLTVTANDKTREYGDPNPGFDATITGFKNGQNLTTSGVTGTASCSSSATMTSPVADYSITCTIGGLLSGNYSFT